MKKFLWALVPVLSLGTLCWLPFVVLKERVLAWSYAGATVVFAAMIVLIPVGSAYSALAGAYTVGMVASAVVFIVMLVTKREQTSFRDRHPYGPSTNDPFKK